jgi:hypothetical protein
VGALREAVRRVLWGLVFLAFLAVVVAVGWWLRGILLFVLFGVGLWVLMWLAVSAGDIVSALRGKLRNSIAAVAVFLVAAAFAVWLLAVYFKAVFL